MFFVSAPWHRLQISAEHHGGGLANTSPDAAAAGKHAGLLSGHVLGSSVFAPVSALRNAAMRLYTVTAG